MNRDRPSATYRVQFHAGFTFRDACLLVPYLDRLGVSHLYTSPYLRARSGSTHGYDVADPNALNPELGSEADYADLVAALERHGMGQLVDIVPNHMGIGDPGNYRWLDVLENGPASIYARFFDINWTPLKAPVQDHERIVVPTLGDQYGKVLENGELGVGYDRPAGSFFVAYYEHRFPIAPDTYPLLLQDCLDVLQDELGRKHEHAQELASILTALRYLPPRRIDSSMPEKIEERNREKEIIKRRIRTLYEASKPFRAALEATLATVNGQPGVPESFDRLDALLGQQSYRLAFWRVAAEEINYRRFFDITELAAVRMEDPVVFQDTHGLLLRLVDEDKIQGLRIDHPDGLRDPAAYLRQLQQALSRPSYVVVEKILQTGELLRPDWPVDGTTGYDFLNQLNGLFVARHNESVFATTYSRFLRQGPVRFGDLANSAKKMIMLISLASEVNELAYLLKNIAGNDRRYRDFTLNSLTFVIREIIAALDVYRTYIDPETGAASEADRGTIARAVADARRRNPRTDPSIFDFVGDTLLMREVGDDQVDRAERLRFIARFQQTTGPVMAKGVEDTAFYQYNQLISLNEVGGEPDQFGRSLSAFHRANAERARAWPASMLATSTHDTKRSEDVRARINVLSELPREWRRALTRWSRLNGRKKPLVEGRATPDRNEEYLLYQSLLGAWPMDTPDETFTERIVAFMLKALKEAKVNTSWISPNTAYEAAVEQFVRAILDPRESGPFLDDFRVVQQRVAFVGTFNALSQTVLKLGSPGVADIYQGNELWDFSLVDPDNRRPVDYGRRQADLEEVCRDLREPWADGPLSPPGAEPQARVAAEPDAQARLAAELLRSAHDGRIKLFITHRLLRLRRSYPGLFVGGSYTPLRAGPHVCAFARSDGERTLVVAAPVMLATLLRDTPGRPPVGPDVWGDGWLPVPGDSSVCYQDVFSGATLQPTPQGLRLSDVFATLPVAALLSR
jgi:(1->4)-alpha-D-glucan 1-alpha-D-glucosylmutase